MVLLLAGIWKQISVIVQHTQGFYCTCGKSERQPWCDGSHRGTEWKPYRFKYEGEAKVRGICGCKMNLDSSGAICDSAHKYIHFDHMENYAPNFRRDPLWLSLWSTKKDLIGKPKP